MRALFLHPNFPAQFRHVAAALGREGRHKIVFATKNERPEWNIPGVEKALYKAPDSDEQTGRHLVKPFADAVLQGEAVYKLLTGLKAKGFRPDIIYGHSGWGTTLYIKEVFPEAPFLGYFEWFYDPEGYDANFDPPRRSKKPKEKPPSILRTRNAAILNDLWVCDRGICPTHWQKSQFPVQLRDKLQVLHDGVDTDYFAPDENARLRLPGLDLSQAEEIVTYASRGMEPYRGFPQFMQAVDLLLKKRKSCHVVIAASERVCYGSKPKDGKSWKEIMLSKLDLDMDRLHFTGSLPYGQYKSLLQASKVHVYLTRPFVLSWSAVESMACGCSLVASDTPPVREALRDRESALLADFYSPEDIALRIEELLEDRALAETLSGAARAVAEERYSLKKLLPRHLGVIADTARGRYCSR
jgi:glycosyltransferase involved in cell wall biosynthesis